MKGDGAGEGGGGGRPTSRGCVVILVTTRSIAGNRGNNIFVNAVEREDGSRIWGGQVQAVEKSKI
jgi:hypothetical protein